MSINQLAPHLLILQHIIPNKKGTNKGTVSRPPPPILLETSNFQFSYNSDYSESF